MKNILILVLLLCLTENFAQDQGAAINLNQSDPVQYPIVDLHLGISLVKGFYAGSIVQISDDIAFDFSYGGRLFQGEEFRTVGLGANLYIEKFILNLSYIYYEHFEKYFSHNLALSIQLFSIEDPGFHLIGGMGAFGEIKRVHSDEPESFGVLFNLALGFTIL